MNYHWNLEDLYQDFESEEFIRDSEKLKTMLEDFDLWTRAELTKRGKTPDEVRKVMEEYLRRLQALKLTSARIAAYSHLRLAVNASDDEARRAQSAFRQHSGVFKALEVRFQNFVKNLSPELFKEAIETSTLLQEHSFFLEEVKQKALHLLSEEEEVLISKMRNTGSAAFTTLQNNMTAGLVVEVPLPSGQKKLPLAALRNLAFDPDPQVRRIGYEAEQGAYPKVAEISCAALNAIKGEVLTVSEMKGFESPLEETLEQSRMTEKTLKALLSAIESYLPKFRQYLRRKGQLLGYDQGLPFYELFAPVGKNNRTYSYEEAMAYIIETFEDFHEPIASFIRQAYEEKWLDVEPREGKRGGAFCSNLPFIGQSRILANFNGSFSNLTTLAHELGHGYHGAKLKDESILNTSYSMPVAETASIFNETVIMNRARKDAKEEERLAMLETAISDANQVITDIYSRFVFEKSVFEHRQKANLSVAELNELMLKAQETSYGDGLAKDYRHPYMWLNKPHYYSAGLSYYNFPYAFGLLFAKGLYVRYLTEGPDFLPKYDELLRRTGQMNIKDLTAFIGIDIEDESFFRGSLELIAKDIDEFLKLTEARVHEG